MIAAAPSAGPAQTTCWPAVLAAVLGGVAIGMNVGKVPLALPAMRTELGLTLMQSGWVSSMLTTLAVVAASGNWASARWVTGGAALIGLLLGLAALRAERPAMRHAMRPGNHFSSKCGFATLLDPLGGQPASAGLGALKTVAKP